MTAAGPNVRARQGAVGHGALKALATVATLLLVAWLGAVAYLYLFQRSYVFKPGGALDAPSGQNLAAIEPVTLETADGVTLSGWYAPAAEPERPTLLYFHGNAGNLSDRAARFERVLASGFGLLAMSYRGYPGSGGSPSEAALFADALTTYDWLAGRTGAIVLYGESLGSGVAAYVAAERPAAALVLEAPYTAAIDMAGETYPWVPVSLLMRDPFLTREHIARVDEPTLIVHGTDDRVIPVEHGRRLFEYAREPKQLAIVEGGGHSDLWKRGIWRVVEEFLRENAPQAAPDEVRRMPSLAG